MDSLFEKLKMEIISADSLSEKLKSLGLLNNPFEILGTMARNSNEIMQNNMKYHKAAATCHQAIHDMMEAIDANAKIMKGE